MIDTTSGCKDKIEVCRHGGEGSTRLEGVSKNEQRHLSCQMLCTMIQDGDNIVSVDK